MAKNVIDIINEANSDAADATAKTQAAVDANQAASDATKKAAGSRATEATVLHATGEVFVRSDDGSITTYDCPDGVNIATRSPKDAATLAAPGSDTPGPAPDSGGTAPEPEPTAPDATPPTDETLA